MCDIPHGATLQQAVGIEQQCIARELSRLERLLDRPLGVTEKRKVLRIIQVEPHLTCSEAWVVCNK